jgi:hypothetical protein
MKFTNTLRTSLFTTVLALLLTISSFAQAPEKMSYQAVIRNADNALVTEQEVGMQISILQGATAVYVETHTPTSNTNGLVSLEIGLGTAISGSFTAIDWSADTSFITIETDPTGGTAYTITGTSQLLSVPYALYANTSSDTEAVAANTAKVGYTEALVSANTDVAANTAKVGVTTHAIGDTYGGGIVFYVYDNGQHGLIAATADQSTSIRWYGGSHTNTRARTDGVGAGSKNTAIIIANQGSVDGNAFAATLCNEHSVTVAGVTYGDWYLPSKHELNLLYFQKDVVGSFSSDYYWSSTEYGTVDAWIQSFNYGYQYFDSKSNTHLVRAVRAF